jgi:FKBP-type peptidyl-prolyl cis-trans isomerase
MAEMSVPRATLLLLSCWWALGCAHKKFGGPLAGPSSDSALTGSGGASPGNELRAPSPIPSASADVHRPAVWSSAPAADAKQTASGLLFKITKAGTGQEHPSDFDRVKLSYSGWSADGVQFDTTVGGEPRLFTLTQVIPAWNEALKQMVVGESRRLWVPARLAFGDNPLPGVPRGDLLYDVELTEIIRAPHVPEDVAFPPFSAQTTPSGLAYRVLKPGTGKEHPRATDTVTVNFSGWTKDGMLFDSSSLRNGPTHYEIPKLIAGLAEALTLMVPGETTRFWIPANLAYGDTPADSDRPAGPLVFDIELLK